MARSSNFPMRLPSVLRLAFILLLAASAGAFAADLNGRWSLHFGGPDGPEIIYTFKVDGTRLTGSSDSPFGAGEIRDGRVDGATFSFSLVATDGNLIPHRGRMVSDNELALEVIGFGDGTPAKVVRAPDAPAGPQPPPAPTPVTRTHSWWQDRPVGQKPFTTEAKKLPLISVQGNKFVDAQGRTVLFRGLAISDPDKLDIQGHWNREHFVKVKEMGTMVVRIPVHPAAWRQRTPVEYLKMLDQAVYWCTELDMYVMIDWHSIGNLVTGVFQDPMYDTTLEETNNFWRIMARHYAGHQTVAFFELFNEPTTYRDQLGPVSWSEWKRIMESQITMIRAANPHVIPVVAGFDWAYDLTPLRQEPINAERIAYAVHPYSNKRPQPWVPRWELDFGFAAGKYPVIATEFGGFPKAAAPGETPTPAQRNANYGPEIIKYLEGRGISWIVWCFDPQWGPTLIKNWNYELNDSGEFVKAAMHGEVK